MNSTVSCVECTARGPYHIVAITDDYIVLICWLCESEFTATAARDQEK